MKLSEQELFERAKKIKALALDSDGVLFTGRVFVDSEKGEVLKERSLVDGVGISLLRAAGIRIVFISAQKTGFLETVVNKLNNLSYVREGKWEPIDVYAGKTHGDKVSSLEEWLGKVGIDWSECAYMGDDISDYLVLQKVGLAASPAQAEERIKEIVHFVAARAGGKGAIRDFAEMILSAKGIDVLRLDIP